MKSSLALGWLIIGGIVHSDAIDIIIRDPYDIAQLPKRPF